MITEILSAHSQITLTTHIFACLSYPIRDYHCIFTLCKDFLTLSFWFTLLNISRLFAEKSRTLRTLTQILRTEHEISNTLLKPQT